MPLTVDGTINGEVEFLLIGMKNLANRRAAVIVTVFVCSDIALYPVTPPEIEIFRQRVIIPAGDCAVIRLDAGQGTFTGNNMLRVAFEGDTAADEADGIVVALSGGKADGRTATSMIFKHEEFIDLGC
ncbi:hypothetical protein AAFN87_10675 [Solibacillus sp. CAU 1738]